jgi:Domain of unknown function (DUF4440)
MFGDLRPVLVLNFKNKTMKTKCLVLMMVLFSSATVLAQKKAAPGEDFFIAKMKTKFDLAVRKDTAALRLLLHDSLLYIHSGGNADTKASFLNKIATSKNPYTKFTVSNEKVRYINAKTVLVHARSTVEYADGSSSYLLITEVYTKERKDWLLISRHANKIEPGK